MELPSWSVILVLLMPVVKAFTGQSPQDLLAYPQYEIQMSAEYTLNETAINVLNNNHNAVTRVDENNRSTYSKLLRTSSGQPFLCAIPYEDSSLSRSTTGTDSYSEQSPDATIPNEQAQKTQDIESLRSYNKEQKDIRIQRGLELLEPLKGKCLYQRQGWFTYALCYGENIRQFHAIRVPGLPGPREDPNSESFTLGQYPQELSSSNNVQSSNVDLAKGSGGVGLRDALSNPAISRSTTDANTNNINTANKNDPSLSIDNLDDGQQRFLVQTWPSGSVCEETGSERSVQVQFHCNSQSPDKIALIREKSICQYVLVVHTARLCKDPVFLGQSNSFQETNEAKNILCQPVLDPADEQQYQLYLDSISDQDQTNQQMAYGNEAEQNQGQVQQSFEERNQDTVQGDGKEEEERNGGNEEEKDEMVISQDTRQKNIANLQQTKRHEAIYDETRLALDQSKDSNQGDKDNSLDDSFFTLSVDPQTGQVYIENNDMEESRQPFGGNANSMDEVTKVLQSTIEKILPQQDQDNNEAGDSDNKHPLVKTSIYNLDLNNDEDQVQMLDDIIQDMVRKLTKEVEDEQHQHQQQQQQQHHKQYSPSSSSQKDVAHDKRQQQQTQYHGKDDQRNIAQALNDGEVFNSRRRYRRNSAGYKDLNIQSDDLQQLQTQSQQQIQNNNKHQLLRNAYQEPFKKQKIDNNNDNDANDNNKKTKTMSSDNNNINIHNEL